MNAPHSRKETFEGENTFEWTLQLDGWENWLQMPVTSATDAHGTLARRQEASNSTSVF
jgi:hypothetical protein